MSTYMTSPPSSPHQPAPRSQSNKLLNSFVSKSSKRRSGAMKDTFDLVHSKVDKVFQQSYHRKSEPNEFIKHQNGTSIFQTDKNHHSSDLYREMLRLNERVRELEIENAELRNRFLPTENINDQKSTSLNAYRRHSVASSFSLSDTPPPPSTQIDSSHSDGSGKLKLACLAPIKSTKPHNGITKSKSFADGFGYTGLTVQAAAAASHRSRSRKTTRESLNKYRAGYWNKTANIKSSFSCNNLADLAASKPAISGKSSDTHIGARIGFGKMQSFRENDEESSYVHQELPLQKEKTASALISPQKAPLLVSNGSMMGGKHGYIEDTGRNSGQAEKCRPSSHSMETTGSDHRLGGSLQLDPRVVDTCKGNIRLWTGTWNMGAADPFTDNGVSIDERRSSDYLKDFIPLGYHLYVIGVQESVSEHVYHAIEAYLNRNQLRKVYFRLDLKNCDFLIKNHSYTGEAVIDAVRGRGDGAFVGTKFTGIAVFYAVEIQENIKLIRSGAHKFNLTSGSKGGVAVALMLNQTTTIVFVNCHLDARNDTYRREQIKTLNACLGRVMGHHNFDLTFQFHHVVWMGDLNYRIVSIDSKRVLQLLGEGRVNELHDRHDGLLIDRRNGGVFEGYTEPAMFPDFYPTYKKFPKRGFVDESLPSWPTLIYRTIYKEPFYKGGKIKTRVPGWCDRILSHSLLVSESKLMPEKVSIEQGNTPIDNYRSVNHGEGMDVSDHSPVYATFVLSFPHEKSRNDGSIVSSIDAFATSRGPNLRASLQKDDIRRATIGESYFDQAHVVRRINRVLHFRPVSTVLHVHNVRLMVRDDVLVPKRTRLVAPLVGEDPQTVKQCDILGERRHQLNGWDLSLNAVLQHRRPLRQLHMLMWVKHEGIIGHCTLSLKRIARQEHGEVKFRVPLHHNSARLYHNGQPVLALFSLRSKTFAK
uniref:Uncharacterized protein AlNc14C296G10307 n=1 Tax=Albugo laibachii Nc14 TaxID=890382 RepID=F0WVH2_9STRA|nr:conserved hypothetical protein [Albugo laibachii Nc14]|eukprot:CCA25413.1 conserved hypothetical protein [Albugo laibachii Nc14]